MKKKSFIQDQSGTVLIVVAAAIFFLIGMVALTIDIGHLMVVRNEVQNAADAGALAGARKLYTSVSGTTIAVNSGANTIASSAVQQNKSDNHPVEVLPANIEKGHWCFSCPGPDGEAGLFTPNDSVGSFTLDTLNFPALEANTSFINAVRVKASRGPETRAASYFARIFGHDGFSIDAEAVAWVGFSGSSFKVDQPLAICRQSMLDRSGNPNCSGGRLINSNTETGAWTNLEQGETTCDGAASTPEVRPLICTGEEISIPLHYGQPLTLVNGEVQPAVTDLRNCWQHTGSLDTNADKVPDKVWKLLLPMIDCDDQSPICKTLIGAISVEVFWITGNGTDPQFNRVPTFFNVGSNQDPYTCPASCAAEPCPSMSTDIGRKLCWLEFLKKFNVKDENGAPYTMENPGYTPNTVYFKPACEFKHEGSSGGAVSNVIAEIPKLVK